MTRFLVPAAEPTDTAPNVEGNSRLTASTGLVLTVLLLVEGFTVLDVRGYITLHTAIGLTLIGPLALKCATTMYRFARYYTGRADYVSRGAPPLVLRVLGPLVILSSISVIATGVALLAARGHNDTWLTLHQASFIGWVVVTGLHFLGHIYEAVVITARDVRRRRADTAARGRLTRLGIVAASLVLGAVLAAAFTASASSWNFHDHGDHRHAQLH